MKWYTLITSIWFLFSLVTFYRITGLRGGVAEVLEVALLPGTIWLICFGLHMLAKATAPKTPPTTKPE